MIAMFTIESIRGWTDQQRGNAQDPVHRLSDEEIADRSRRARERVERHLEELRDAQFFSIAAE